MGTWLVVGADRGIGNAVCRRLATRGDDVLAACLGEGGDLASLGCRVEPDVDVTRDEAVERLARRVREEAMPLTAVLHVAGIMTLAEVGRPIAGIDLDDVRRQFEVNALGPMRVARALSPLLAAGARVGIVTSRVGSLADNGSGDQYGYRLSKAAANMLGLNLHHEWKRRGIAVACLHPGMVATDLTAGYPGQHAYIAADQAAAGLLRQMDALTLETAGVLRHANGERLPW